MSNSKIIKKSGFDKNSGFIFYRLQNSNNEELKESIINNISVNGLSFKTPEPITPGVILECEIYKPRGDKKDIIVSICAQAKVVNVKKIGYSDEFANNRYRVELKFLKKIHSFSPGIN
ncbi:MAG: PilZ domain-containing protein [Candidatus Omnitrophica bacterium]|nr:PilZ domain-containing protein [Candidatus Omnitrophota bacterium]